MSLNTLITSLLNGHPLLLHISSVPLWNIVLNPELFSALVLHFCCETPGFSLWIKNVVSISFSSGKRFLFSLFLSICPTPALFLSFSMAWLQLSSWPLLIPFSRGFWWAPNPGEPHLSYSCLAASLSVIMFTPFVEAEDLQLYKDRHMDNRF